MSVLDDLEARGVLSMLDVELARGLSALAGETDEAVQLGVAFANRAVAEGHVCLDLATRLATPLCDDEGPLASPFPSLDDFRARLAASKLVGPSAHPLVLEGERLYLARYHDHESTVARHLLRLAERTELPPSTLVEALFPPQDAPDLQREAALASRGRRLSVIVGGPGTGKTSTVVKLLALLVHDAAEQKQDLPRILMLAPTGKAAQRLAEATMRARDRLPVEERLRNAIPVEAVTVHRALGSVGGSSTVFRHGPERPLDADVVLLDEASMVDLALMRRLLDAIAEGTRVIMLGDPDQLASVEAGGVLGDVCAAAEVPGSPLSAHVSRLTQSYRYPAGSGIEALARAVHEGDAERALAVLRTRPDDVESHGPLPAPRLGRALENEVKKQYAKLTARDVNEQLAALDGFRILCAHRRGDGGVESVNLSAARLLRGRITRAHESYAGRPILVVQNDYGSRLFNGDVGVLSAERRSGPLQACFLEGTGTLRRVALGRLPAHESVYAMTVHKSQGSEFERVAIVLPERSSEVVTRELLYTAITRAKRSVSLYASDAAIRAAIARRVTRASGLSERLRAR